MRRCNPETWNFIDIHRGYTSVNVFNPVGIFLGFHGQKDHENQRKYLQGDDVFFAWQQNVPKRVVTTCNDSHYLLSD